MVWNASPAWQGKALQAVADHATTLLSGYSPIHADLAGTRLIADLTTGRTLSADPPIRAWAEDVVVTVDPDQLELARHHAQHLREQEVAAAGHGVERTELRYLRETVFKDTASAALWWLRHHDHDVTALKSVFPDLEHAVKLVDGGDAPGPVDALITAFDALTPDLDHRARYELHQQLAHILSALGRSEAAESLLSRAGAHPPDEPA
ncbi:hypothetical protein [Amycolatopsis sp. NPDC004625]|uniref:hypothetical protein n=1 Tax=Amycolatopsis sp. NPDC004625 TaxID=3154670 RepID=UPI0033BECC0C